MSIYLLKKSDASSSFNIVSQKYIQLAMIIAVMSFTTLVAAQSEPFPKAGEILHVPVRQTLNFEQALQQVQQYQSQNGVWQAQQQIAEANIKQSRLWANPTVSVQQKGIQANQELEFGISQKLDVFGERRAAKQLAEVQSSQVGLNQALYQAQLKLAVKFLWSQIEILQLQHQVATAQLRTSQATLNATRLRYQAGSIAQLDLDRSLMTHIENQRVYQETELALSTAKKQLANLWGESHGNFSVNTGSKSSWPDQSKAEIEKHLQQNLFEHAVQLHVLQQRSEINYLKAKRRPAPTVNLGMVRNKIAGSSATENQVRLGIEIPLNIINRQQYPLAISQTKLDLLDQQLKFYKQQNLNTIQTLQSELDGLQRQYQLLNDQQIPLSETVQEKMLLGFKVGKYAITDVQQATLQLQEQRLKKIQLLKDAWRKAIEAESLALGIEPELIMSNKAFNQINQNLWQDTFNLSPISGAE